MRILITNDDGVGAAQLIPLIKWCQKLGDVTTFVPKFEQSGKSHGFEIHKSHISGFHQYCLEGVARPIYISRNLCNMLDLSEEELLSECTDLYAEQVHPADRKQYDDFLKALSSKDSHTQL